MAKQFRKIIRNIANPHFRIQNIVGNDANSRRDFKLRQNSPKMENTNEKKLSRVLGWTNVWLDERMVGQMSVLFYGWTNVKLDKCQVGQMSGLDKCLVGQRSC